MLLPDIGELLRPPGSQEGVSGSREAGHSGSEQEGVHGWHPQPCTKSLLTNRLFAYWKRRFKKPKLRRKKNKKGKYEESTRFLQWRSTFVNYATQFLAKFDKNKQGRVKVPPIKQSWAHAINIAPISENLVDSTITFQLKFFGSKLHLTPKGKKMFVFYFVTEAL